MRRVMTIPSPALSPAVIVSHNRMRDDRVACIHLSRNHDLDLICGQNLKRVAQAGTESACVSMPRNSGHRFPAVCDTGKWPE